MSSAIAVAGILLLLRSVARATDQKIAKAFPAIRRQNADPEHLPQRRSKFRRAAVSGVAPLASAAAFKGTDGAASHWRTL